MVEEDQRRGGRGWMMDKHQVFFNCRVSSLCIG
jgi:hypothetical protein